MNINSRIKKLLVFLEEKNIDCFITTNPSHIFYLTDLKDVHGYLFVDRENLTLFTSGIYYQYALDKRTTEKLCIEKLDKNVYKFLKKFKKPAISFSEVSLRTWKEFSLISKKLKHIDDIVMEMRKIKKEEEIVRIKNAYDIAEKMMEYIKKMIKPGLSEIDVAAEILYQTRKLGAEKEAFQPIVASGVNSSYPHHQPSRKKIEENDVVVIDTGCCIDGYCSDITETIVVGKMFDEVKNVFSALEQVHKDINELLLSGEKSCKKLHIRAVKTLKKFKLDKFFVHSLGHGVGIDVHELPILGPSSKDKLKKGMVFTIEPGVYIPGKFGVRIERMFFF